MMESVTTDALSGLAPLLRVCPVLEDVCRLGGAWATPHGIEPNGHAYFHIVTRGHTVVDLPAAGMLRLEAGDILLLPHGDAHTMRADAPLDALKCAVTVRQHGTVRLKTVNGAEPDVELICGRLQFAAAPRSLILAALPETVVLRIGQQPLADRFSPLVLGIGEELASARPGAGAIATDLASALFVMMLRAHLEAATPAEGLLRLFAQRMTAQAVLMMVRDPVHAWTLDELADAAAASRASLVRAFRKAAGFAPLEFLTDLRLGLARHRLRTEATSIERIAVEVGYQSQAALSRAFLRKYGVRPGSIRRSSTGLRESGDAVVLAG